MGPAPRERLHRLGWFVAIWAGSVAALGLVSAILRAWLA